jgi:hypothetical protein
MINQEMMDRSTVAMMAEDRKEKVVAVVLSYATKKEVDVRNNWELTFKNEIDWYSAILCLGKVNQSFSRIDNTTMTLYRWSEAERNAFIGFRQPESCELREEFN